MLATCPLCQKNISHLIGNTAICECGWSGSYGKKKSKFSFSKPSFNKKKFSSRGLMKFSALVLAGAAFTYGAREWQGFMLERSVYVVKSAVKLNSAQDEFRMAVICHKLRKQECKELALAKAYKKDSQNVVYNGEFAIALSESGKHEAAILAFQKYYTEGQGSARHHLKFAESLGQMKYYKDSKEWYYKAIMAEPGNLEIAESLMNTLSTANMYGEALSVIGHFNMVLPKTQKIWHNLALKIKADFKAYQEKFNIREMTVSKIGNYFFAPAILAGAMDMQLFIVNPESIHTTVDLNYLKSNGIVFQDKGSIEVTASTGQSLKGTRVILPSLTFAAWTLTNVEAVACENCAFVAGKSVLKQLAFETTQVPNTQVSQLTLKEK